MTLKSAALLALIGTALLTILLAVDFTRTLLGIARDVVPAIAVLRSSVDVLAALSLVIFFYAFHKAQS